MVDNIQSHAVYASRFPAWRYSRSRLCHFKAEVLQLKNHLSKLHKTGSKQKICAELHVLLSLPVFVDPKYIYVTIDLWPPMMDSCLIPIQSDFFNKLEVRVSNAKLITTPTFCQQLVYRIKKCS